MLNVTYTRSDWASHDIEVGSHGILLLLPVTPPTNIMVPGSLGHAYNWKIVKWDYNA